MTQAPRDERAQPPPRPGTRRFAIILAIALLALGGTAVADRLLTASEVFSSPDAVGQGDINAPVHPSRAASASFRPWTSQAWAASSSGRRRARRRRAHASACGSPTAHGERTGGQRGGNGPACFTERDDPIFKDTLIATGIDSFETDIDAPFHPHRLRDHRLGQARHGRDDRRSGDRHVGAGQRGSLLRLRGSARRPAAGRPQLVAYDAAGRIVTAERAEGDPSETPLGPG